MIAGEMDVGTDLDQEGRDDDKPRGVNLPSVLSWFIGELPPPSTFDGKSNTILAVISAILIRLFCSLRTSVQDGRSDEFVQKCAYS